MTIENLSITMVRPTLDDLPEYALPAPYRLRWYQPGDEAAWLAIHHAADRYLTFTPATFAQEFGTESTRLATCQAYLCPAAGPPCGTATAWSHLRAGEEWGLVHWVAIHPDHQGKGLAKPLLAHICHQLYAAGHRRAYLNTATARLPAIKLYLSFGFVPAQRDDQATTFRAWQQLQSQLQHPAIARFLAAHEALTP